MIEVLSDFAVDLSTNDSSNPNVDEVLRDYAICVLSREASNHVRRDVLNGRGKFGISGDGKEVPQVAMARAFKKGDFYSGYYRDQTFMFALGIITIQDFFAQLYADFENDHHAGGRNMNNHYASPLIDANGNWTNHNEQYNIVAGHASTAGQMPRALGLAYASNKFRASDVLNDATEFSQDGNEVTFSTIGDASTSEGVFWETLNAAGVLQTPLAMSVWDDGYGISVPIEYQTTKSSISAVLQGFQPEKNLPGVRIYTAKGWDYPSLCEMYERGIKQCRDHHEPALFHVRELTQPNGHSTSGSHERYKSEERLQWEKENDCNTKMRQWIIDNKIASVDELEKLESEIKTHVRKEKSKAWQAFTSQGERRRQELNDIYSQISAETPSAVIDSAQRELNSMTTPDIYEVISNAREACIKTRNPKLKAWSTAEVTALEYEYEKDLYSSSPRAAINIEVVHPEYSTNSNMVNGFEVLQANFTHLFEKYNNVYLFGEDVGKIGDVNQGAAGLQSKFGEDRVFDTGIREWTIMGQAHGMAIRGLRPIAEIQYLDYLVYGLPVLTDDVSTLRFRSNNRQQAPVIIRTRGHRLEGIWHSGSQMGLLLNSLRGMHICVPRNMVQAAGMYNTLLKSDDPALVIESLNGYRLKERIPDNVGEYTVPLGVPELITEGDDLTLVTYGSCVRIAERAAKELNQLGVTIDLIDVQTLLPFDLEHRIVASLKKTNRVIFLDEDVPGGGSAYMMREVLENQGGFRYLDSAPLTLTAKAERPPYGSNGDYIVKPNQEDIIEKVIEMLEEVDPNRFLA